MANIEAKNNEGSTALLAAMEQGEREVVMELLEMGANVNIENNNEGLNSPLLIAAAREDLEMMKMIVERGGKISTYTISLIAENGSVRVMKEMVRLGGNIINNGGPFLTSVAAKRIEMAKELLEMGARIDILLWPITMLLLLQQKERIKR